MIRFSTIAIVLLGFGNIGFYAQPQHKVFVTHGRLQISAPGEPLRLAESNLFEIRLQHPSLTKLISEQTVYYGPNRTFPEQVHGAETVHKLMSRDGLNYINIVPRALGKITFRFISFFSDGGIDTTMMDVEVVPPSNAPEKLSVQSPGGFNSGLETVLLPEGGKTRLLRLQIQATYAGLNIPVDIGGSFAQLSIRDNNSSPAISIDQTTGFVKPLHRGHSILVTTFGGVTNLLCVVVRWPQNDNQDRSGCSDLLLPGEKLGPDSTLVRK